MPKKSNKKSNNTNEQEEIEEENENNIDFKLLSSKILNQQKRNYDIYVEIFLKCGGVISLAY